MEQNIFLLVIFAAILHAIWNGMVKSYKDKVISVSAIVFGHVPMAILVMLFLPLPTLESVPFIILSAIIHQGYQYNLISAYTVGDLTKVYPIARGTGPIVATIISVIFLVSLFLSFQDLVLMVPSTYISCPLSRYSVTKSANWFHTIMWCHSVCSCFCLFESTHVSLVANEKLAVDTPCWVYRPSGFPPK